MTRASLSDPFVQFLCANQLKKIHGIENPESYLPSAFADLE